MKVKRLMIHKLETESNGLLSIVLKAAGGRVEWTELERGDIIETDEGLEVVSARPGSSCCIETARRSYDNIGIELTVYTRNGGRKGLFLAILRPLEDPGYESVNKLLKQYGK